MNMSKILTETGLNLPEKFTDDEFREAGQFLGRMEHGMQWAIGDWYNAIPWGDKQKACEEVGLNYQASRKYAETCETFQIGTRVPILAFNAHKSLTHKDLSDEQRSELLKKAENEGWTIRQINYARDKMLGKPEKIVIEGFDAKVDSIIESITAALPATVSKKVKREVEKGLLKLVTDLKQDFLVVVEKSVNDRLRVQRESLLALRHAVEEDQKRIIAQQTSVNAFLSRDDFNLVRSCLHPDKHNNNPRYARAFDVFNQLEKGVPKNLSKRARALQGWEK